MNDSDLYQRFAAEWISAWNSHEVDRILAHYAENVIYRSPFVAQLGGSPDGHMLGKAALREYVLAGLRRYPKLCFLLRQVYAGIGSVVIEYDSVAGLVAAETFVLDETGRACQVFCHYSQAAVGEGPRPH
jgi:hypothetical protein